MKRKDLIRTNSEEIFEKYLKENKLEFEKIKEAGAPRPDYLVKAGDLKFVFEVKELAEDNNFKTGQFEVSSRTVGEHIRRKISDSKKQIQYGADQGIPSILLIYNNIDRLHLFGTEDHDFIGAMYGEYTVVINRIPEITDSFHGRNKSFSEFKNTSFSAVGRLAPYHGGMKVTLFENIFSNIKLQYEKLPKCFDFIRVTIKQ